MLLHYIPIINRMTKIKNLSIPSSYKDVEQVEFLCIADRNENWYSYPEKHF